MTEPYTMLDALAEIERLRAECEEQARLNGMGAERELALRAEIERLRTGTLAVNYARCAEQLAEVAAFLDALADRIELFEIKDPDEEADDCREMAKKLRGET